VVLWGELAEDFLANIMGCSRSIDRSREVEVVDFRPACFIASCGVLRLEEERWMRKSSSSIKAKPKARGMEWLHRI
jgi:hypothetical protein